MEIDTFLVEQFIGAYEHNVEINLAETCVEPFTLEEFLSLVGREEFLEELKKMKLITRIILRKSS